MDVLYSIIGNGQSIEKSSLYMAMIMKMLWNCYVDMVLQFYIISGNKGEGVYAAAAYRKQQQEGTEGVGEVQKGKAQKAKREVGGEKIDTYTKRKFYETKAREEGYDKTRN
eukprot:267618_1